MVDFPSQILKTIYNYMFLDWKKIDKSKSAETQYY